MDSISQGFLSLDKHDGGSGGDGDDDDDFAPWTACEVDKHGRAGLRIWNDQPGWRAGPEDDGVAEGMDPLRKAFLCAGRGMGGGDSSFWLPDLNLHDFTRGNGVQSLDLTKMNSLSLSSWRPECPQTMDRSGTPTHIPELKLSSMFDPPPGTARLSSDESLWTQTRSGSVSFGRSCADPALRPSQQQKTPPAAKLPGTFEFMVNVLPSPPLQGDGEGGARFGDLARRMEAGPGKPSHGTRSTGRAKGSNVQRGEGKSRIPDERQSIIVLQSAFTRVGQHSTKMWETHKEVIRQLYLEERRSLKDVADILAEHYGFVATPKMYKTKFSSWGFGKNTTEKEAKQILFVKLARDAQGKGSVFSRNGKQIDLERYLKRKGATEDDLLGLDAPGELPPYVRVWTPPPMQRATEDRTGNRQGIPHETNLRRPKNPSV